MKSRIKCLEGGEIFYGVGGCTKIGLVRSEIRRPMYLDIEDMFNKYKDKKLRVHVTKIQDGFVGLNILDIERSEEKLQTYKYVFNNDCSNGKYSFGTEEDIIATPDTPILKKDGSTVPLEDLNCGDEVVSIKRLIYSNKVSVCTSRLFHSFKYYKEYVYNVVLRYNGYHFCANGFFIGGCVND